MKSTILFLSLLFSCLAFSQPKDIKGWGKTHWGMTEKELLKAFPGEVSKLEEEIHFPGGCIRYEIPNYEVGADKFRVLFYTDSSSRGLTRIDVESRNENPLSDARIFDNLDKLLHQKYGNPSYENKKKDGDITEWKSSWHFHTTTIELSYMASGMDFHFVILSYKPSIKSPADKL